MADVTKIKLPNGSEYDIKDSVSGYITAQTTLAGYGITDAKIDNGSIILGSNSITPLTSFTETDPVFTASAAYGIASSDITNWNNKISGIEVNGTLVPPTSGVVDITVPSIPTNVSSFTNDAGYITSAALSGYVASITTANLTVSDTAPSNPSIGDIWIDTSNL